MSTTYKLQIQYDGTRYKGWQKLKNTENTIQGKIETVLTRLFDEIIEIDGSGRTDAGVHALKQVASFKSDKTIECPLLMSALNEYLPEDIIVTRVQTAPDMFHARFNAKSKTYSYQVWKANYPPVFERNVVFYQKDLKLDTEAMKAAANLFIGKHDFKGFSSDKTKKSTVRTIEKIDFIYEKEILKIVFRGDGFLHNMVRIIVGTLLEVGRGERQIDSIEPIFEEGIREKAGFTAPAKGLFLMEVQY